MADELLFFNGVNGETGGYALPPASPREVATRAFRGLLEIAELQNWRMSSAKRLHEGDAADLAQAGWAVLFAQQDEQAPARREALRELLEHRSVQAGRNHPHYYRELIGDKGYRLGDTKNSFLARFGVGPGPADPDRMPYYILIVGGPELVPYEFQYQMDVPYAVGRLAFDTLEEYSRYARTVVEVESATGSSQMNRRAILFGAQHPGDPATDLTANGLVEPLTTALAGEMKGWDIRNVLRDEATKTRLASLLSGGDSTPDLLFTAGHGLVLPNGSSRQPRHQGALLCQGWPGPQAWREPLSRDVYFAGEDLAADARLDGLITFHFACYSGGSPAFDDFSAPGVHQRVPVAPHPFVACLPQRLLAAGALAVIGHVEHCWECSVEWPGAGRQIQVFRDTLKSLLSGIPVGAAMEFFAERYAELATDLSLELQEIWRGKAVDEKLLTGIWTASNDARNFTVLGDPAVRIPIGAVKP